MELFQQVLHLDNMRDAWEVVAENNGMPGVDNVSIKKWRRNWEENLVNLAKSVRCNTYKPGKLRLRKIPKNNRREYRLLKIPTIADRILQRAVCQVLMPVYESRFFECSFGYRPSKGLKNAIEQIICLRDAGFVYVLNADIDAYFDKVDHELLLRFLQQDLPDERLLHLISAWLDAGISPEKPSKGIPQGSPLSPLLANVYLHQLDEVLLKSGIKHIRYADDFITLASSYEKVSLDKYLVEKTLNNLGLILEPQKTSISSFDQGFTFLGVRFFRDNYSYLWKEKSITVKGSKVDWLFSQYGHEYDTRSW